MDWVRQLDNLYLKGQVLLDEPLRRYTSLGIGGLAQAMVFPADVDDLRQLLRFTRENDVPFFILGAGSNLVVRDGGFKGLVISLCLGFKQIHHKGNILCPQAGVHISKLLSYAQTNQLGGLEFLAGVPGTVGGAVVMNAGARDSEIGNLVKSVSLLQLDGNLVSLDKSEIKFSYRSSSLPSQGVVLEVKFNLKPTSSEVIKSKTKQFIQQRKQSQPAGLSAGSIFKNPPGYFAGRLIEEVGLKGFTIGNAKISKQHANFIINKGSASAQDVESLIQYAQNEVYKQKSIWLEPEVKIIGQTLANSQPE